MSDTYGTALKNMISKDQTPQTDPDKAKAFSQGFEEPQTLGEGVDNIKNEVSGWFGKKKGDS